MNEVLQKIEDLKQKIEELSSELDNDSQPIFRHTIIRKELDTFQQELTRLQNGLFLLDGK